MHPALIVVTANWLAYCKIADFKGALNKVRNRNNRHKVIWETIDRSLPIIIKDKVWFIRIMDHWIDGTCLDIREFVKVNDGSIRYEPTLNGLSFTVGDWIKLIDPIFKLLRKWKGK